MSGATDKQYERIIERFMQEMDSVEAPVEDYRAALRDAKGQIDTALDASKCDGEDDL
jgi:hypothetical protein